MTDFFYFMFLVLMFAFVDNLRGQIVIFLLALAVILRPEWYSYFIYMVFTASVVLLIQKFWS